MQLSDHFDQSRVSPKTQSVLLEQKNSHLEGYDASLQFLEQLGVGKTSYEIKDNELKSLLDKTSM